VTYLPQENTEEEIVFVGFPSRFSSVLAEKEALTRVMKVLRAGTGERKI
jgi:hypothetical protein